MQRVLVTGATGFLGRELCQMLWRQVSHVTAIGRKHVDGPWHEFISWDLASEKQNIDLSGIDTIFHLAGKAHALAENSQDQSEYLLINTEGTRRMLQMAALAGVRRFVLFSSVKAIGEGGFECQDEKAECHPGTPYGASKLAAEKLVLEGDYIPEPVVLRLSMVYGPHSKGNLARMIKAVEKGHFPPLQENGNRRSMVHVDDVMQAAVLAAEEREAVGQVFNVTDGKAYSTRQMYEWICEVLRKPVPRWTLPMSILKMLAKVGDVLGRVQGKRAVFDSDALEKLTGSACFSSAKIERQLGFVPRHHLRESLPEIVRRL